MCFHPGAQPCVDALVKSHARAHCCMHACALMQVLVLDSSTFAVSVDLFKRSLQAVVPGATVLSVVPSVTAASWRTFSDGLASVSDAMLSEKRLQAEYLRPEFWRNAGGGFAAREPGAMPLGRGALRCCAALL